MVTLAEAGLNVNEGATDGDTCSTVQKKGLKKGNAAQEKMEASGGGGRLEAAAVAG